MPFDRTNSCQIFGEAQQGETHIGCFVGAPIDVAGQRYGSLNFAGIEPRKEPLEAADRWR